MSQPTTMTIEKDVAVPARDGTFLRADVFRPAEPGPHHPVLMVHGPYGKDIHFEDFNAHAYALVDEADPFMTWETPNPEWWVPAGTRSCASTSAAPGAPKDAWSCSPPRSGGSYYDAIKWATGRPRSTGKVGLLGISYYGIGQ
jgi:putative CocE/NonD family hydrolase